MKKILLFSFLLTIMSFSFTLTPNVEVGGGVTKSFDNALANTEVSLDVKTNKKMLNEKIGIMVGGGVSQNFYLNEIEYVLGQTSPYFLGEANFKVKNNIEIYTQIRVGLGTGYVVNTKNKPYVIEFADLGGGIKYKQMRVGCNLGVKGGILSKNALLTLCLKLG